jgi:phage tail sheath protein FI
MANVYKTPGVYVEEISKFPPSVADVPTAIPAFIGYTAETPKGKELTRISSLLEYEKLFGTAPVLSYKSKGKTETEDGKEETMYEMENKAFVLYDSLRLFYDNGGGVCYIVSIGKAASDTNASVKNYQDGIKALTDVDEVTLLAFPDAATLLSADDLAAVQQAALKHCRDMGDRFAILDVKDDETFADELDPVRANVEQFRNKVGVNGLNFGAAYCPYLTTVYSKSFAVGDIAVMIDRKSSGGKAVEKVENAKAAITLKLKEAFVPEGLEFLQQLTDEEVKKIAKEKFEKMSVENLKEKAEELVSGDISADLKDEIEDLLEEEKIEEVRKILIDKYEKSIKEEQPKKLTAGQILELGKNLLVKTDVLKDENVVDLVSALTSEQAIELKKHVGKLNELKDQFEKQFENQLKEQWQLRAAALANDSELPGYKAALEALNAEATVIPPSGAIAGIISSVDNFKGVWSAPANVSVSSVSSVVHYINDDKQQDMNVDATAGKSVNAIRPFTGKGILVWGARTLDGNSNEWRYIPVRRLFNYIEESIKKSTSWAVFSPNDGNTWIKIKSQIENFLNNLWRQGALAGSKAESAYYVNVGLGTTMDAEDILNGRLIIEIGLAAVRPAEFIILKFSHKIQE